MAVTQYYGTGRRKTAVARVVLTAGHCVVGSRITAVIVGSKNWLTGDGDEYRVEDVVEYPDSQRTRDLALVFLEEPVKNVEALANPEALDWFRDRPELSC